MDVTLIFKAIPLVLGVVMLLASVWEFFNWRQRGHWKEGRAISLGGVEKAGDVGTRLAYEFTVDGDTFKGLSSYMRGRLPEKDAPVRIYYDPADPQNSDWYDAGMHYMFMFGVALLGLFLLWMSF